MRHANYQKGVINSEFLHYHPLGVVDFYENAENKHNKPITQIHGEGNHGAGHESFKEIAEERGTIFIYELVHNVTQGNITM